MHILVTGGFGFIGHHVVNLLKNKGHKVTIVDDLRFITTQLYLDRGRRMDYGYDDWLNCDCAQTIVDNVDVIIHLACHPNQASFAKEIGNAWQNTINSTLYLLTKYPNAKFVYISSSMVYGNWVGTVREDDPLRPINDYGKAKLACERLVQDIAKNWVIIRPTAAYGIGDNPNRVISKWILAARNSETINVDDPLAKLDFTYVSDIAQAVVNAATTPVSKVISNVSYGEAVSLYDTAKLIIELTQSESEIICSRDLPDDMPRRGAMDTRTAIRYLGYTPKIDLESGIKILL
jgi:UDP-glucose 4-epimerase